MGRHQLHRKTESHRAAKKEVAAPNRALSWFVQLCQVWLTQLQERAAGPLDRFEELVQRVALGERAAMEW